MAKESEPGLNEKNNAEVECSASGSLQNGINGGIDEG
jgi:hypothetical protein